MADSPDTLDLTASSVVDQPVVPDAIARILAAAVVSTLIGSAVTKLFGRKAGFVAFVISASAHEMFDAPLAQRFSRLGI